MADGDGYDLEVTNAAEACYAALRKLPALYNLSDDAVFRISRLGRLQARACTRACMRALLSACVGVRAHIASFAVLQGVLPCFASHLTALASQSTLRHPVPHVSSRLILAGRTARSAVPVMRRSTTKEQFPMASLSWYAPVRSDAASWPFHPPSGLLEGVPHEPRSVGADV